MTAGRTLTVAAVPLPIVMGDVAANLATVADALRALPPAGPRLAVLPELATSGYAFTDRAEAASLAMPADDARLATLCGAVPEGTVAVVGFCERDTDGRLFNAALVLDTDAVLGRYRKAHLWDAETLVFNVGDRAGTVVATPIGAVGVAICYDNEFPEVPRGLALAGAEVLALPTAWPLVDRPAGAWPPELVQTMGSARSSRLPTVVADRHGRERDVVWTGGTAVVDADGWVIAASADGAPVHADVTVGAPKTLGTRNDLFADRRPDLYGDIVAPGHPRDEQERP